jgi:hypothetical protein
MLKSVPKQVKVSIDFLKQSHLLLILFNAAHPHMKSFGKNSKALTGKKPVLFLKIMQKGIPRFNLDYMAILGAITLKKSMKSSKK